MAGQRGGAISIFLFSRKKLIADSEKFLSVAIMASTAYETDKYMGAALVN